MLNVLIAGGAGFLGSHLTDYYLSRGARVTVLDNLSTGSVSNLAHVLEHDQLRFIEHDICEQISVDVAPDIVFHLACPASPVEYRKRSIETYMVNSIGTHNLLALSRNSGAVFVMASTSEVYGNPSVHPQTEAYWGNVNPIGVRSCYDEGKRFAEGLAMDYFRRYGTDVRIMRIFNTYGPRMKEHDGRVVSNFIVQLLHKQSLTVYGDGSQTRSFCYVTDLIRAMSLVGEREGISGEVFNLGNPNEISISELVVHLQNLSGLPAKVVYEKLPEDDPVRRKPDISKAKRVLNWEPLVALEDGLRSTMEFFEQQKLMNAIVK